MRINLSSFVACVLLGISTPPALALAPQQTTSTQTAASSFETCTSPIQPAPALMHQLIGWIGQHTDYDVAAAQSDLPAVTFCKTGEVIDYEGRQMIVDRSLNAAYDEIDRRIWLVLPWSPDNARDVSVLLHELVHDVQFRARSWPCPQASEQEAYRLQHDWLAEQGVASGFNWFAIHMRARCPSDVHP